MPPGSDVGTMSMIGYDPNRYHTGRAPIEAASMGIAIGSDDVVFRMNLVSLAPAADGATVMKDFTSGHITSEEAAAIVGDIRSEFGRRRHRVLQWRQLSPSDGVAQRSHRTKLTPPHDITGKASRSIFRKARARIGCAIDGEGRGNSCATIRSMRRAGERQDRRDCSVWFWGQGKRPAVPTLKAKV